LEFNHEKTRDEVS